MTGGTKDEGTMVRGSRTGLSCRPRRAVIWYCRSPAPRNALVQVLVKRPTGDNLGDDTVRFEGRETMDLMC